MKRFLILSFVCMFFIPGTAQKGKGSYVEVIYFHGRQRCITCKAIEKYTREVVNTDFSNMTEKGKVRFREVDISTPDGGKLAEKYRVSWSSLYVNRWENGMEERYDMTHFGFQNALSNTAKFKEGLKQKICGLLN